MFKKDYYISRNEEEWVSPEETLLDSGSEFSNIEQPIASGVFRFLFFAMAVLGLTVFGVVAKIALANHDYYATLAIQNKSENFTISAPRGIIFDRNGTALVQNLPSFDLIGVSKEIGSDPAAFNQVAYILNVPVEQLTADIKAKEKTNSIFTVQSGLTKGQILQMQIKNPIGFYVIPNTKRSYVDGSQFSQVVGYISKVSKDDLARDPYYTSTDTIGRLGVEASYEDYLRGDHGRMFFGDSSEMLNVDTVTGKNVVLNIDYKLQKELYNQLYTIAVSQNLARAAAIIQNPNNGQILAMVSLPSFDNNIFVNGLSTEEYNRVFNNKSKPLFNRVISGLYNPGSTIKPLMGLMGLEEKVITPNTTIHDCVSITIPNPYNKDVSYTFKNWKVDLGNFNLRRAIANSCNIFFFSVGGGFGNITGLGINKIVHYLQAALADTILGIDIAGEEHGFVPTPDWKEQQKGEQWYQGDTYNTSIGQGDLLVTPLWLNTYISAVANGGSLYQPEVANRIVDNTQQPITIFQTKKLGSLPFSDENLKEVKSDMQETVISGTASLLKDLPVSAGAKTGTAEVVKGRSINSLFSAFAPFSNPQISITVLVEGSASNQGLAIRTAHNVLQWYFNQQPGSPSPTASASLKP